MKELLRALDFGSSVAEFDESLEKYFVENEAFHALVHCVIELAPAGFAVMDRRTST